MAYAVSTTAAQVMRKEKRTIYFIAMFTCNITEVAEWMNVYCVERY
jgi:hypothetical protein